MRVSENCCHVAQGQEFAIRLKVCFGCTNLLCCDCPCCPDISQVPKLSTLHLDPTPYRVTSLIKDSPPLRTNIGP